MTYHLHFFLSELKQCSCVGYQFTTKYVSVIFSVSQHINLNMSTVFTDRDRFYFGTANDILVIERCNTAYLH